ncbi:MAG: leucine-rich repeat domain-containing protein [Thermoguttaceae bacterium]|nr:leucine-rich repeat domain-containing protein [Thermoguttaceae bacterium]
MNGRRLLFLVIIVLFLAYFFWPSHFIMDGTRLVKLKVQKIRGMYYYADFLTIPDGVTEIGDEALKGCAAPETVIIPAGVKRIGNSAFSGCNMNHLVFLEGVKELGDYAFSDCEYLNHVMINKGMTKIGNRAFSGCSSLKDITIPESVTEIGQDAFEGCPPNLTIYAPRGSKAQAYALENHISWARE